MQELKKKISLFLKNFDIPIVSWSGLDLIDQK